METNQLIQGLQQPQAVAEPTQFNALQSLGIFNGRNVEDRDSALLRAGLAMMQPTQTGGLLEGLTGGINAGLADLDRTKAAGTAEEQRLFQNEITQQKADSGTINADASATSAGASVTNASANVQNADTNEISAATDQSRVKLAGEQHQFTIEKFDQEWEKRITAADLDRANAEWLRRRHDGTPAEASAAAGGRGLTSADLNSDLIKARARNLLTAALENGDLTFMQMSNGVYIKDENGNYVPDTDALMTAAVGGHYADVNAAENPGIAVLASKPAAATEMRQGMANFSQGSPSARGRTDMKAQYLAMTPQQWAAVEALPDGSAVKTRALEAVLSDPQVKAAYAAAIGK